MTLIRQVLKQDIPELKMILDTIQLFPSDMLEDMISDYFDNPESQDIWFTAIENGKPISIGYCAPEKLTSGTCNLYAIGVDDGIQGKGIGSKMMSYIENELRQKGHRLLIVETSGADMFRSTREFYEKLSYVKEATIKDFWEEGEDKIIYSKKLS
jgi:ribosomal protein S18 acetylase RimI-like enzyme